MKSRKYLLVGLLFIFGFLSCNKGGIFCHRGTGDTITENRSVSASKGVHLSMNADVFVSQPGSNIVEVRAQENIIGIIETVVRDRALVIRTERGRCISRHNGISVYTAHDDIDELQISGSGTIQNETPLETDELNLSISGSGDIVLDNLKNNRLDASISGSGKIIVDGPDTSNFTLVKISGSGDYKGFQKVTRDAEVRISGSGNIEIHAIDELEVYISGSGNVYYTGNPKITTHISGSGDVINKR